MPPRASRALAAPSPTSTAPSARSVRRVPSPSLMASANSAQSPRSRLCLAPASATSVVRERSPVPTRRRVRSVRLVPSRVISVSARPAHLEPSRRPVPPSASSVLAVPSPAPIAPSACIATRDRSRHSEVNAKPARSRRSRPISVRVSATAAHPERRPTPP